MNTEFFFESSSAAMHARKLLLKKGIAGTISRVTGEKGCGYVLSVGPRSSVAAYDILNREGIHFVERSAR